MSKLVPPHGGELIPLLVHEGKQLASLKAASLLTSVKMSSKEESDLVMLAMGAFSPLEGFMGKEDYLRVIKEMRLGNGLLWPIPVTLSITTEQANAIREGDKIALTSALNDDILGSMTITEMFTYDKSFEVRQVFGTTDLNHPGVAKTFNQGDIYLAGPVVAFSEGSYRKSFPEFAGPVETRSLFCEKGWETVAAFQTRNPIHRSHEYLTKIAMEVCDGLFIHPIVGNLKPGDIPADVRMECYRVMLENYYPKNKVVLKVYPMEMRYAGPKEALLHAIIRQNFGCSHLIIGRDHAGVGNYYGPYDAQKIFDEIRPSDLSIRPLKIDNTFWCHSCFSMATLNTCPHSNENHLNISGTRIREMLSAGERPPEEYSRKEVSDILIRYYQTLKAN